MKTYYTFLIKHPSGGVHWVNMDSEKEAREKFPNCDVELYRTWHTVTSSPESEQSATKKED